ncbi:SAP30-binding protein isoform X3 [Pseudophryne corroboree]|uniref:SAP30-binding protein isoform X3 n=1 Tax=Pseudophryne corroboree TaxID=495146 RepID=UPI0030813A6D
MATVSLPSGLRKYDTGATSTMAVNKKNVLSSLAVYVGDSEPEPDSDVEIDDDKAGLVSKSYGLGDMSRMEEEGSNKEDDDASLRSEEEDSENDNQESGETQEQSELEKKDPQELVASFSERVRNMLPDDIKIPPEPPGRCSNHLQEKIHRLYEKKLKEGTDMNQIIQKKKEFRNPSIYEKLIQFCSIDELGTNYPKQKPKRLKWTSSKRQKRSEQRLSLLLELRKVQLPAHQLAQQAQPLQPLQMHKKGKASGTPLYQLPSQPSSQPLPHCLLSSR